MGAPCTPEIDATRAARATRAESGHQRPCGDSGVCKGSSRGALGPSAPRGADDPSH